MESSQRTTTSHLKQLKQKKKTTTFGVGKQDPGLRQVQQSGSFKLVNETPTLPFSQLYLSVFFSAYSVLFAKLIICFFVTHLKMTK